MRSLLSLICILGISCALVAQTNQASWTNLNGLLVGQKIQVDDTHSKKHNGVFATVSDAAISIKTSRGEESVQKQDVRTVKQVKTNHRMRNTLIGTGVGTASGAAVLAAAWPQDGWFDDRRLGALVGGVFGLIGGTVIGAVIPSGGSTTIYSASPK